MKDGFALVLNNDSSKFGMLIEMNKETFGPIIWILPVDTIHQTVEIIKRREKPLCLYLFSYDSAEQEYVINETDSGTHQLFLCFWSVSFCCNEVV